jgi:vacuolar protein sorting-associated protein 45
MRKAVDSRGLYDISELEQDIVCSQDSVLKHFKAIDGVLNKEGVNKLEALRLVMLFSLRYEDDSGRID